MSVLLAVALPPAAAAASDPHAAARVPFTLRANKVVLPVTIPGVPRTLRVLLDSGMGTEGLLLFDSALLDSVARRRAGRARIGGAGAGPPQTALVVDSATFRVGADAWFTGQRLIVLEGSAMREGPSDGVCGHTLLAHHAVELDYGRMEMVLHPAGTFRPDSAWTMTPLRFKKNRIPWVDVTAGMRGPDSVRLACYIDLASSESVELLTRDGASFDLPDSLEEVVLGRGLSGEIRGRRGRIAWVRFGPSRLERVVAAFTPAAVRSKQPGADAVVGNGLLRRFDCVFDYAGGRLWLRPNAALRAPW